MAFKCVGSQNLPVQGLAVVLRKAAALVIRYRLSREQASQVRSAMAQGGQAQIAGVVHTVMPSDGAVVAYRRFFTGAVKALDKGDGLLATVGMNLILGDSAEEYLEVRRSGTNRVVAT